MMKKLSLGLILFALTGFSAAFTPTHTAASGLALSPDMSIGAEVEEFKLPDADGKERSLSSLKGKHGTVLIFVSVQCPVSNAYNDRMVKLAEEYKARGINVVGINANATESAQDVKKHAADKGLSFPILKDTGNKLADRLGALVTPEAFFLDEENRLVYRGRIDNSRNGDAVTSNDLREALDTALAGRAVTKTEARAFGCSIKRAS